MRQKPEVLVTFDSMRYPNTGFFYFGKSLSGALSHRNKERLKLCFYTHRSTPENLYPLAVKKINKSLLHKLIFPYSFDLYHFTDQYCRLSPEMVSGKKIITIHDLNPLYELRDTKKISKYLSTIRGYINTCHHVVAISKFVAEEIIKNFPECRKKISIIYNGADSLKLPENHKPHYQPQEPYLFTIGSLTVKKNFHVLPALLADNNFELVIAGIIKEDYKAKILNEAEKNNCLNRVKIIGTVSDEDKAWYYQHCSAFLFPSLAEGFGLPVIEAMNFGKPVFLSKYTSLPEIGGDKAFYFNNFEPNAMRDVFKKGMDYYSSAEEFRDSIAEWAQQFNWEKTAESYLKLYEQILYK